MLNQEEYRDVKYQIEGLEYVIEKVEGNMPGPLQRSTLAHLHSVRTSLTILCQNREELMSARHATPF